MHHLTHTITRTIPTLTTIALATTATLLTVACHPDTSTTSTSTATTLAPCPTEDSTGPCHWNASHQGDGNGHSFTRNTDGTVTYTD